MENTKLEAAAQNRADIESIKHRYIMGQITREQAQFEAAPVIERINNRQQQIAKAYGKKNYPKTTFISVMR